jgi:hypothetical protein
VAVSPKVGAQVEVEVGPVVRSVVAVVTGLIIKVGGIMLAAASRVGERVPLSADKGGVVGAGCPQPDTKVAVTTRIKALIRFFI